MADPRDMADPVGQVHIAGAEIQVGSRLRQRCSWCGGLLLEYDLKNIAWPEGQKMSKTPLGQEGPGAWPVDALVRLTGINPRVGQIVDADRGEDGKPQITEDCCAMLDDEVTA